MLHTVGQCRGPRPTASLDASGQGGGGIVPWVSVPQGPCKGLDDPGLLEKLWWPQNLEQQRLGAASASPPPGGQPFQGGGQGGERLPSVCVWEGVFVRKVRLLCASSFGERLGLQVEKKTNPPAGRELGSWHPPGASSDGYGKGGGLVGRRRDRQETLGPCRALVISRGQVLPQLFLWISILNSME